MKARVIAWLERRWYGGVPPAWPLCALATLYGVAVQRRRARFLEGPLSVERVALPVVVVGNLTVGGAGKTPLVIALVEALRARGWRPGVVSRGYGGSAPGPERVLPTSDPTRVGDEPCLIAVHTQAPIAIARQRIEAARMLVSSHEVDILIADDGLQHYALGRDLEVLVIDGGRRYGNESLLPAGPLREPLARARACDFQVVNVGESSATEIGPDEIRMSVSLQDAVSLDGQETRALSEFAGRRVHAVAGLGNPERFFQALRGRGIEVVPHPFPDHHRFRAQDLAFPESLPLLMTEKDAVKCRSFAASERYAVPLRAVLPETFFDSVDARLRALPLRAPK